MGQRWVQAFTAPLHLQLEVSEEFQTESESPRLPFVHRGEEAERSESIGLVLCLPYNFV